MGGLFSLNYQGNAISADKAGRGEAMFHDGPIIPIRTP